MVVGTIAENFIRSVITFAGLMLSTFYFIETRYSKKTSYLLLILFISSSLIIMFLFQFFFGIDLYLKYYLIITLLPSYFFFWVYGKDNFFKSQFNFLNQAFASLMIVIISIILTNQIYPNIWVDIVLRIVLIVVVSTFELKKLKEPFRRYANEINTGWNFVSFLSIFGLATLFLLAVYPLRFDLRPAYSNYIIFSFAAFYILIIYVVFFSFHSVYSSLNEAREKETISVQMKALTVQLEQQNNSLEMTRVYRHDMRHHLETLLGLLQDERVDIAQSYISDLSNKLDNLKVARYCDSPVMNSLFSFHFNKAKELGIEVKHKITIPLDQIDQMDCTVLFANIVENALNACEKMSIDDKRFIDIRSVSNGTSLSIQCSNSFKEPIRFDSEHMPKAVKEGHGIGTKSIMAIVTKYNGIIKYSAEKGKFTVRILLNLLPKKKEDN